MRGYSGKGIVWIFAKHFFGLDWNLYQTKPALLHLRGISLLWMTLSTDNRVNNDVLFFYFIYYNVREAIDVPVSYILLLLLVKVRFDFILKSTVSTSLKNSIPNSDRCFSYQETASAISSIAYSLIASFPVIFSAWFGWPFSPVAIRNFCFCRFYALLSAYLFPLPVPGSTHNYNLQAFQPR